MANFNSTNKEKHDQNSVLFALWSDSYFYEVRKETWFLFRSISVEIADRDASLWFGFVMFCVNTNKSSDNKTSRN